MNHQSCWQSAPPSTCTIELCGKSPCGECAGTGSDADLTGGRAAGHCDAGARRPQSVWSMRYQGIKAFDYFIIQGVVFILVISIAFSMLLIDLIYPLIDPRVKISNL